MDASRDSSPDILGDNDEDRSSGAPLDSPTADSDAERPLSSTQMTQSISQSCSGSGGSPSPGLRLVKNRNLPRILLNIFVNTKAHRPIQIFRINQNSAGSPTTPPKTESPIEVGEPIPLTTRSNNLSNNIQHSLFSGFNER